jgi:hypothetical protein
MVLNQMSLYKDKSQMIQNRRYVAVVLLLLTSVLAINAAFGAVSTEKIDAVRRKALDDKNILENSDFEVIDAFWAAALEELLISEDFSEIVTIRAEIFARRGGAEPTQYSVGFISSAQKHLESAFDEVQNRNTDRRKTWIERNLMILAAELESPDFLELGMRMLDHENGIVRYWAVKSVTSPIIVRQLNSELSSDAESAIRIVSGLESVVEKETYPEILNLIAGFAGQVTGPQAKQLLLKIVDLRTIAYEKWTVKYELMDAKLLRSLGNEILSPASEQDRAVISRKFAQLYSYAMQRYLLGANVLSDVSKQQLASVLVEVEQLLLDRLLGRPQSTIKKAVEKILTNKTVEQKDYSALEKEHDSLLGSTARKGDLSAALNFDYGKNPDGSAITAPKKLGPPPEAQGETEATEAADETAEPEPEAAESGSEATEPEAEVAESN